MLKLTTYLRQQFTGNSKIVKYATKRTVEKKCSYAMAATVVSTNYKYL